MISVNNLAACLESLGDAAAALPLYQRGLEALERVLGKKHPMTEIVRANYVGASTSLEQ